MIGKRSKFGVTRCENRLKIASLTEDVIHISSMLSVPAVLGAETADRAPCQGSVQLVFQ